LRTPRTKRARLVGAEILAARLVPHVALEPHANGEIIASLRSHSFSLGTFSDPTANRAQQLRSGLPFSSSAASKDELYLLIRRLAGHGLIEYCLRHSRTGKTLAVIEPQVSDYWPRIKTMRDTDALVLSRFAYMRRRGDQIVLESPRAGALFKICDPKIATALARFSTPQQIRELRVHFPGIKFLALLVDCEILIKLKSASDSGLRPTEGDDNLVLWDFHDLLFHTRSTEGRHANPLGGIYSYARASSSPPAVRPCWPGKKIPLCKLSAAQPETISFRKLLRQRHSTRNFDDQRPITLEELSDFLDGTAPILSEVSSQGEYGASITYAPRPYPSAGACYELELYLTVDKCEGLARGFYHYDAGEHALVPIHVLSAQFEAALMRAAFAMGAPAAPQILITIAARFARVSWKYSAIAYELVLKDVGVLMQTFYLMATAMGLGGCAIGIVNIDLFSKMTGIEFHIEGPVGQFAMGRGIESRTPPLL
jgi:SagB-type dehydrogenase family enzyme